MKGKLGHSSTTGNLLKGIYYRRKKFPRGHDDQTLGSIPNMMRNSAKSADKKQFSLNLSSSRSIVQLPPLLSARGSLHLASDHKFNKLEFETQVEEEALQDIDKNDQDPNKFYPALKKIYTHHQHEINKAYESVSDFNARLDIRKQIKEQTQDNPQSLEYNLNKQLTELRADKHKNERILKIRSKMNKEYEISLQDQYDLQKHKREDVDAERARYRDQIVENNTEIIRTNTAMNLFLANTLSQNKVLTSAIRSSLTSKLDYQASEKFQQAKKTRESKRKMTVMGLKTKIQSLADRARELDQKFLKHKLRVQQVKDEQVNHYKTLLLEGEDTRSEGLQWIVKALWKLGEAVPTENFPQFLDDDAVHCILFLAQKSMEIEDLIEKNNNIEKVPRQPVIKRHGKLNNVKERLNKLKRGNIQKERPKHILDPKTKETKIIWENITEDDTMEENTGWAFRNKMQNQYQKVSGIEEAIQQRSKILNQTIEGELTRLNRESYLNQYEHRFNTSIKTVLSCIVGVEVIERKMGNLNNQRKKILEEIDKTKTYKS